MTKKEYNAELENENLETQHSAVDEDPELQELLHEAQEIADQNAKADFAPLFAKIKELETKLQEKEEIAKNSQIAYLHLKSDFDILQRQTAQKIETANRDAILNVAKKFIVQIENLRKSLLNLTPDQLESAMGKGLVMMHEGFLKSLNSLGIEAIEAIGLEPHHNYHEPVSMQPVEDENLKGKIIQEFEQGFVYRKGEEEIVIAPSKVVVGA